MYYSFLNSCLEIQQLVDRFHLEKSILSNFTGTGSDFGSKLSHMHIVESFAKRLGQYSVVLVPGVG